MAKSVKIKPQTFRQINRMLKEQSPDKTGLVKTAQRNSNIVKVYNYTASAVPRFGVLCLNDWSVLTPGGDEDPPEVKAAKDSAFQQDMVLYGSAPSQGAGAHCKMGGFVITCEPIPSQEIGRAWYFGLCVVKVNVTTESHRFADADLDTGNTGYLVSRSLGPCAIIWKEYGTGLKWAIVYHGGINYALKGRIIWVKLTNVDAHPMIGEVQVCNLTTGVFCQDGAFHNHPVHVYRYPTYNSNVLYLVNNIIAVSVQGVTATAIITVSLNTLPAQLSVTNDPLF